MFYYDQMAHSEVHKHLDRVGSESPGSFVFDPEEIYSERGKPATVLANNTVGEFCALLGISVLARGLLPKNKLLGTVVAASIAALELKIITQDDNSKQYPPFPPTNPRQW